MSILTLLNAKPQPKVKTKRSQPKPESIGLPRFNRIASWVKFVHPPIGDQAQPEGRGKVVPATCEYGPELPMDSIGCKSQPEARYVFIEGSGYELAQPAPEPVIEQPTKAQYIAAFQAEAQATGRPLPLCVRRTQFDANATVADYIEGWRDLPRRARRALLEYYPGELASAYDRGLLGRIAWYCEYHNERAYAAKYTTTN